MAGTEIETWNCRGSISLWHYDGFPMNYCGFHLTADADGCIFLRGLVERFRESEYPARKKIALRVPSQGTLSVPNCSHRCIPAKRLELRFRRENPDDYWAISEDNGSVLIEMGAINLSKLGRGIDDIAKGNGDWSIGSGTSSLWFWWQPNK